MRDIFQGAKVRPEALIKNLDERFFWIPALVFQ
jgi:hypothetical protein